MDKEKIKDYIETLQTLNDELNDAETEVSEEELIEKINMVLTLLGGDIEKDTGLSLKNKFHQTLPIKVKKLHPNAVIPTYAKPGDAGLDLTITEVKKEWPKKIIYGFGLAVEIPVGYVGLIFPRSSVHGYDLLLTNSVGVIDSGYRGELMSVFKKVNDNDEEIVKYLVGERGAQLIVLPYPRVELIETDTLSETERNTGGFGHSGQ